MGAIVNGVAVLVVLNMMPVLAGQLVRALGLSTSDIGMFASAETIGIALGALVAIPGLRQFSPRAIAATGLLIVLSADLASYFLPTIVDLTVARGFGGLGAGVTLGVSFHLFAETDREKNFAAYSIGQTALALLAILLLPAIEATFGWRALFLTIALLLLPGIALTRYLPASVRPGPAASIERRPAPIARQVWMSLVGVFAFFLGQGALWTFLETIGIFSGISAHVVQDCLAICAAFGVLGSCLVIIVGLRLNPWIPLLASLLVTVAGVSVIRSTNAWVYGASISAFYLALPVFASYQFGAIVAADESRRAAPLISAATFGGFSVAPYVGGEIVELFGYPSLQALDIGSMSASFLTLIPLLWARRKARMA
jgi:predicted MFS family arabinose efflux permease